MSFSTLFITEDNSMEPSIIQSEDSINNLLEKSINGIFTIKPRVFFQRTEKVFEQPIPLNLNIPSSGIGSITLLEASILVSLIRLLKPKKIFEFGTFLGYSTSLFLKNTDDQCEVITIDLGEVSEEYELSNKYSQEELRSNDKKNDDFLRYTQGKTGKFYLSNLDNIQKERLILLYGDSRKINIKEIDLENKVDLVFIDGGHDKETITSDTNNAINMLGDNGIIVWHDYNSSIHSDVTNYVNEFSSEKMIFHVENTMLAIMLKGNARNLFLSSEN